MSVEKIIEHLDDLDLPLPQDEKDLCKFINRLLVERQRMKFPVGFEALKPPYNPQTVKFLQDWGVIDMWIGDDFMTSASDLLYEPGIRRTLEAFLLSPLSPYAISRRLQQRYGLPETIVNARVVKTYGHYFWDYGALNLAEWRQLCNNWVKGSTDDYQAALLAPRTDAGAALSLAVIDRSLDSLDSTVMYATMRDMGFRMFLESSLLQKPGISRTQSAFLAFQMVKGADEELVKHRGASAELLDELKRIETVHDRTKLTTVRDLPALESGKAVVDAVVEDKENSDERSE